MKKLPPIADGSIPFAHHFFKFRNDIYSFLEENCRTKGPVFTFKLFNRTYYVINHPDLVRYVMVENVKNYSRKKSYLILQEMLGHGLITTEGEEWRKRRRIAQPAFHKQKLELLIGLMDKAVLNSIQDWEGQASEKKDLDAEMSRITLNVLMGSIMQSDIKDSALGIKQELALAWKYLASKRFNTLPILTKLPSKTKKEGKNAIASLKLSILHIIENRRKSSIEYNDLLSMYMDSTDEITNQKLTNEELRDEVMTLFTAGHDTTAMVLIWTFYLLGQHPEIEKKVVDEIQKKYSAQSFTMAELMGFQYTKMVIQEVMRLYPPVWTFGRRAVSDDELGGYYIPADARVTVPSIFIHRNPEFWEKPNEFYPEHFLPERLKTQKKLAYFPFGGGQHLCIGEHYAMMEMQLVLIHILRKYKIKLQSDKPMGLNLLITIRPQKTIWVNFEKR